MLAGCRCKNITEYHGSLLKPRSTELMIVMELMACSVADLVRVCRGANLCSAGLHVLVLRLHICVLRLR